MAAALVAALASGDVAFASSSVRHADRHPDAPAETDHFAPLLGTWLVAGRRLDRDGKTWLPLAHPAQWRFYRILNGHAIQDDWTEPAPAVDVPESQRSYGTNIRIYNPERARWEMSWIHSGARETLVFTAVSEPGEIVMSSVAGEPPRRNVFHGIGPHSFEWRQEWSFDGGQTWVVVATFHATRTS
jgi:hypothetical protein